MLADAAKGRDLLVSAQTGSGKTVAYGLAIAENLLGAAERFERAAAPLALIVAPTRELALQVQRELAWLYQYAGRARGFLRRRHGSAPRAARACRGRPYRGRHARPVARSSAAQSPRYFAIEGGRARRGRRNARSGFSRGYGIHPQDHAGHPPHVAVLGDLAARHRRAGEALSATGLSRRGRGRRRRPCRYRISRHPDCAERCRARGRQCAALLRIAERAGVLQHPRCGPASAGDAAGTRLLRGGAVGRTDPERAHPGAAGAARRTRPRLRRHRRGGARHRSAESRSRHPRRPAERRGGHAASLRPHRPRGPQGRQRALGAVVAKTARRVAAESGRRRRGLGHGAHRGRNPQARSGAHAARCPVYGGDDRRGSGPGAGIARRAVARGYRRGTGAALSRAAAFARGCSRSRPGRRPLARLRRPGKGGPHVARPTIAPPDRARRTANHRSITAWRRAASGFAPPSDAGRTRKPAGCCR